MRTRLFVALCTAPLLAPLSSARAQEYDPPDETEGMDFVEPPPARPGAQAPNGSGGVTTAPGQVHTVTNGDTLWDLSQQYLGSPWYWPKVWSYNPEIANPHWIYPGNRVRFFPSNGEEAPQQVAPAPTAMQQPLAEEGGTELDALPSDLVTVSGPIGYQGAPSFPVSSEGFVTREELEGAGVIEGSRTDAMMLSYGDVVYVRFKRRDDARVGDRYQIFRPGRAIHEPVSGRFVGHLTHIVGELVVVDLAAELITARVQGTVDEVRRGDRVGPAGEVSLATVRATPNQVELRGRIAAGMAPVMSLGEYHKVILDRGGRDGIEVGNTAIIVRSGDPRDHFFDPAGSSDKRYPDEDIGACLVLEVREQASVCILTRSLREIVAGDRYELRAQAPSARLQ